MGEIERIIHQNHFASRFQEPMVLVLHLDAHPGTLFEFGYSLAWFAGEYMQDLFDPLNSVPNKASILHVPDLPWLF